MHGLIANSIGSVWLMVMFGFAGLVVLWMALRWVFPEENDRWAKHHKD